MYQSSDDAWPKTVRMVAKKLFWVAVREGHALPLTCAYSLRADNLSKPFSRLIDRQLMNLLVQHVMDGGHHKWSQYHFSSLGLKKLQKKRKKLCKNEEGKRRKIGWKEEKSWTSSPPGEVTLFWKVKRNGFERERERELLWLAIPICVAFNLNVCFS